MMTWFGPLVAVAVGSLAIWKLVEATVYRITSDENDGIVGFIFACIMLLSAVGLSFLSDALHGANPKPELADAFAWSMQLCLLVAACSFVVLIVAGLTKAFRKLTGAIRGN